MLKTLTSVAFATALAATASVSAVDAAPIQAGFDLDRKSVV